MANPLKETVESLSRPTSGRDYAKLDTLIAAHPKGVTLTWLGECEGKRGSFTGFICAEEPTKWYAGSGDIKKLWEALLEKHGGCMADVEAEVKANPARIRIAKIRKADGGPYTKIYWVEDNEESQSGHDKAINDVGKVEDESGGVREGGRHSREEHSRGLPLG